MRIALVITLLFAVTLPCFAELTEQDLEKIGNLIDRKLEPIKLDIAEMKGKMATKDDIIAIRQDLSERMDTLSGRIDTLYGVIIGVLVAIIMVILSIIFTPFLRKWIEQREQVRVETEFEELKAIRKVEEKRKETARRIVEEKPEFEEAYKAVGLL
jgi:predicted PurR-regulated permease PerM